MFHTGDTATSTGSLKHAHPLTLDAVANLRPELKIVICHFGNPWISDVAELIYKHPNVYADISGLVAGDGGRILGKVQRVSFEQTERRDLLRWWSGQGDLWDRLSGRDVFKAGLSLCETDRSIREDIEKISWKNAMKVFFPES